MGEEKFTDVVLIGAGIMSADFGGIDQRIRARVANYGL